MRKARPPERPMTIQPITVIGGRCPACAAPARQVYDMSCACCNFAELCCRACASPAALRALAELLLYQERLEEKAGALIERETWAAE